MAGPVLGAVSVVIGGAVAATFGRAVDTARNRVRQLGDTVSELNKKQAGAQAFGKMKDETVALRKELQQARDRVRQLQTAVQAGGGDKLASDLRKATREVERLDARYQEAKRSTLEMGAALRKSGVDTTKLADEQRRLAGEIAKATKEAERQNRIGALGEKRNAALGDLAKSGAMLGATVAAMRPMVGIAGDLEFRLARFSTVSGMAGAELAKVREQILSLSKATNQMPTELMTGLEYLVGKGLSPEKSLAAIGAIGKAATATGANIEDLSAASYALINNSNIAAQDLPKALDIMGQAAKEGGFELKNMAKWFPDLTSSLRKWKVEGLDATASISSMLQVALTGAGDPDQAANNVKNMFQAMSRPETIKNFEKVGVNIEKQIKSGMAKGQNPIEVFLYELQRTTGGDPFRIGEIVGDMQAGSAIAALLPQFKEYVAIRDKSRKASGVVDKDFATMMATMTERTNALSGAMTRAGEAIGKALIPALNLVIGAITPVVEFVGELANRFPGVTAAVGGAAVGIGVLSTAMAAIRVVTFTGQIIGLSGAFGTLVSWVPKVIAGMRLVTITMMTNPIGLILVGIGAALAAIVYYWDDIKAAAEPVIKWLGEALGKLGKIVDDIKGGFASIVNNPLFNRIGSVWNAINGMPPTAQQAGAMPPILGGGVPAIPPPPPSAVRPQAQNVDQKLQVLVTVNNAQASNPQTVGQLAGAAAAGALKDFGRGGALYDTP